MKKNLLVVVDMQNDFIDGPLGTAEAKAIVPKVAEKIAKYIDAGDEICVTMDTHDDKYLETQEGKNLPIKHCIKDTKGWLIHDDILTALGFNQTREMKVFEKDTFGSTDLASYIRGGDFESIEFVGLCTDICVISNVLMTKAYVPERLISVDVDCCAGVTPESHQTALDAMKACQITLTGTDEGALI